ncbi:MAG: proline--tRNA ligase [Candidatus Omnitrophica bacterium]|nr:proline--tRNA ligase [Candidatus Omnitrophota bacterium]MBU4488476.1 proline--tRNA ligase [Candidatus Omnitrophota bacterium]MCG2705359.1 proline--tRNA ligase [Candidatus Omnitrophota bacterium]
MRMTKAFIPTLKENPADAEVISHKLMIRAGLIRRLSAGAYTYLPLGLKVLQKVESIIREEMNRSGAEEILMPAIHPKELWDKTGRFDLMADILMTYKDKSGKVSVLGPTHEEIVTDLVAKEIKSYRDLPKTLYQIQTKFRDEPRPRFGVLRSKEFIMKDAYSFDRDAEGLSRSYDAMYKAYCRIFERCALDYKPVEADTGFMGGDVSHEFMVPSQNGEDVIALCEKCGYASNLESMECVLKSTVHPSTSLGTSGPQSIELKKIQEVDTPAVSTIEKVGSLLKKTPQELVKTLVCKADGKPAAVLLRGDHELNEAKLKRLIGCEILEMADAELILKVTGAPVGFAGPVGLKGVYIITDNSVKGLTNFAVGANKKDKHLLNANLDRDFKVDKWGDVRIATEGDPCPKCGSKINIEHAIEVGHTFKLGTKYSKSLGAKFLDEDGKEKPCIMGCYGIGVNRIVATSIEKSNDKDGIIWPLSLAPYQVIVLPLNAAHKESMDIAEGLYKKLLDLNIEVLLDDRPESAGIKFKDADLIGVPIQIVIGERNLANGKVELKTRKDKKITPLSPEEAVKKIKEIVTSKRAIFLDKNTLKG